MDRFRLGTLTITAFATLTLACGEAGDARGTEAEDGVADTGIDTGTDGPRTAVASRLEMRAKRTALAKMEPVKTVPVKTVGGRALMCSVSPTPRPAEAKVGAT